MTARDYDRRMVGIALLTLVPGELGGSETYARELLRALGRSGELDYRVLLPPAAPEVEGGLPAEVAAEYLLARTVPRRLAAMTLATARPGPLRRRLRDAGVVHYPLTLRIPTVRQPSATSRCSDLQHLDTPQFPTRRAGVPVRGVAPLGARRRPGDRDQRVRARPRDRLLGLDPGASGAIHLGIDHDVSPGTSASRSCSIPRGGGRTRTTSASSRPRDPVPGAPELRLVLTGGGHGGPTPGRCVEVLGHIDSTCSLSSTGAPRRSSSRRSTRGSASRRSRRWRAGVPSCMPERRVTPGGGRRCGAALRPVRPGRDRRRRARRAGCPRCADGGAPSAATFSWGPNRPRTRCRLPRACGLTGTESFDLGIDEQRERVPGSRTWAPSQANTAFAAFPTRSWSSALPSLQRFIDGPRSVAPVLSRRVAGATSRVLPPNGSPGCDHVVGGFFLLQHQPLRADVVAGVPPVPARRKIADAELVLQTEPDRSDSMGRPCAGGTPAAASARCG